MIATIFSQGENSAGLIAAAISQIYKDFEIQKKSSTLKSF